MNVESTRLTWYRIAGKQLENSMTTFYKKKKK